jgi:thiamine pyrophosphokinase
VIIHILGGGPIDLLPDIHLFHEKEAIWVGVDRGVHTLLSMGIRADIAFGDFDSVSESEFLTIQKSVHKLNTFKPEKDETDMELALNWAIEQNPDVIRMFGGTGGRLDHMFANIQLLINPIMKKCDIQIEIIDHKNIVYIKAPGIYPINKMENKKYISFIPISNEVKGITLEGFKYPLTECHICLGSTLCISNELINDCGTYSFSKGILMIVRSTD